MLQPTRSKVKRHVIDVTQDERPAIPRDKRAPRFVYVHYPQNWEYVTDINAETGEAWGFLPKLKKILGKPGANGVRQNGTRLDLAGAIRGHESQGATLINPTDTRLPEEYQNYVGYVDTNDGGRHFVEIGEELTVLPGGRTLHNYDDAIPIFRAFRLGILNSGILPPMMPEIKDLLLADIGNRINMIGSRMHNNPHFQKTYDGWLAKRDGIIDNWDAFTAGQHGLTLKAAKPARTALRKTAKTPEAS